MADMDDKDVGKVIRGAREQAGLSQSDVGEVIYLSRQAIGDRENGRTGFRVSEVVQLQKVLNVKIFD